MKPSLPQILLYAGLVALLLAVFPGGAAWSTNGPAAPSIEIGACGEQATKIHIIQGTGAASPLSGQEVVIEGVVVGLFQDDSASFGGFFVQEEDADVDLDARTSEGLFVYEGSSPSAVQTGDLVRVSGTVTEYADLTELNNIQEVLVCPSGQTLPSPVMITQDEIELSHWEQWEGMRVHFPQSLVVTEHYELARFGQVGLSLEGRLFAPTSLAAPGAPALAVQAVNDRRRILLDDGQRVWLNSTDLPPYLAPDGSLRIGDAVTDLIGVLDYRYGEYRVQPVGEVIFARLNPRPVAPSRLGLSLRIASFNVLNYFTTLDTGDPVCGPSGGLDCRGADSADEFERQRDKIITAMLKLDADILGLIEIENNPTAALQDLVSGLNVLAGPGAYTFINTGTLGTDAIRVALIYQPARVSPVGDFAVLDDSFDPAYRDDYNRPALAQTFVDPLGGRFTVVVNHLKSKSSGCEAIGDPDTGDGQGNCNLTRTAAAEVLADWLATDPTGSGDPDFLITGDLNAYALEDPLTALQDAGYVNLLAAFQNHPDRPAYSYLFEGQSGALDHALVSPSLVGRVVAAAPWPINADEPRALDYNDFNHPTLYQPDEFRASDHDPVLVQLRLEGDTWLYLPVNLRR